MDTRSIKMLTELVKRRDRDEEVGEKIFAIINENEATRQVFDRLAIEEVRDKVHVAHLNAAVSVLQVRSASQRLGHHQAEQQEQPQGLHRAQREGAHCVSR